MTKKSNADRHDDKQARIIRLQAALKIARDGLKRIADGDVLSERFEAAEILEKVEERMMKR